MRPSLALHDVHARAEAPAGVRLTEVGRLTAALDAARANLLARQDAGGFWQYELEADCTIPAEYVLMMHFLGESDPPLEAALATYIRRRQGADGGWPLYTGGAMDLSATVKAYFALKLAGDDPHAPHLAQARAAVLARGGAACANVFTRITLALFGELPWDAVPFVPAEIVLFPRWFPFHLHKVSYWSRTVVVPLSVLTTLKPRARNPRDVHVRELVVPAPASPPSPATRAARVFRAVDAAGRRLDRMLPRTLRRPAIARAERWTMARLNGTHGLGAIFPAMVNACEALWLLGYGADHPCRADARRALANLVVHRTDEAYCQPCVSPVWDTALACLALLEDDEAPPDALARAVDWLRGRQVLDAPGDWSVARPRLRPGGWAFQFENPAYPDLDDTAVAGWVLHAVHAQAGDRAALERAADWLVGMQCANGGFAAFDADNDAAYLNDMPFADHGALLDPPTSDVTARVVTFLSLLRRPQDRASCERALGFLRREQRSDGPWYGRWGTNYVYGTWSVLQALAAAGVSPDAPEVCRAAAWLEARQRPDGGWGETNDSYFDPGLAGIGARSTSYQTAWAMLALMAAGRGTSAAVARGADYLLHTQRDGAWHDPEFNAPGFPRVFHLKYHGYSDYFPFWALARYRNVLGRIRR